MPELHFPFIEAAVLVSLGGAALVGRVRDTVRAHRCAIAVSVLTLLCTLGAWQDFALVHAGASHPSVAHDRWDLLSKAFGAPPLVVDELTAPLLPMIALLHALTILATQKTKVRRVSFGLMLLSESILLATFACRDPWPLIGLLALGTLPAYLELRRRRKPARVYVLHMATFVGLLVLGRSLVSFDGPRAHALWVLVPLLLAVLIRGGLAPFHCWVSDLFEHAAFGPALLFVLPITGAYAAIRLLVPIAPDGVLRGIGLVAIATALYAAGMSLIQTEARRFFAHLFVSHAALVFVGLDVVTPIGLTGALCAWLSTILALGSLGLAIRALEARFGRLSLITHRGLYEQTPALAISFAVAGLASVGFPGTAGFIGMEMLLDGAVHTYPYVGVALLAATALNGISIVRAYFLLFTGTRHAPTVPLRAGFRERFAAVALAVLLLVGGLYPQPGVASRHEAAEHILKARIETAHLRQADEPNEAVAEATTPRPAVD